MVWPGSIQAQCRNENRKNRDVLKLNLKIWLQKWMIHKNSHLFSYDTSWYLIPAIPCSHVKGASNQMLWKVSSLCLVVLMFAFTKQQNMILISPKLTYVFHFMPCSPWQGAIKHIPKPLQDCSLYIHTNNTEHRVHVTSVHEQCIYLQGMN